MNFKQRYHGKIFQLVLMEIKEMGLLYLLCFLLVIYFLDFSKDMLANTKTGNKTNIKKYLSDITFEDAKGWISINDGKYDCDITRRSKKTFHLTFHIIAYNLNNEYNISIDDGIDIL